MLSAASILLVRRIWFRNALLQWLHADASASETVVDARLPGHSCDLAEANHQLTWVDQSLQLHLSAPDDWICASSAATHMLPQLSKWPSPPGRDGQPLLQSICRQSRSPIPLQRLLEISQGIDVLWACYHLSAAGVLKTGPSAAAVLELRGADVCIDPAPSVAGGGAYRETLRSSLDVTSAEQALVSASAEHLGLGIGFDASTRLQMPVIDQPRAALPWPQSSEERGVCSSFDNWWRQWC